MNKMILILAVFAMMIPTHLFVQGAESKSVSS